MTDFDTFCRQAWDTHGDAPEAVAAQLAGALSLVQAPPQVAGYAALVTHVYGVHLARWADGLALLDALRRGPAADAEAQATLARHAAALRLAAGEPGALAGLPPAEAVAAQAAAADMCTGRGDWAAAIAGYDAALAAAEAGLPAGAPALRALAVTGNNLAAALEENTERSAADTAAMLRAAEGGLRYWRLAGTWLETERAEYRLACSQLQAGLAAPSLASAERCLALCRQHQAPPFECFFAHAARARAQQALGDAAAAAAAAAQTRAAYAELTNDERGWCEADLKALP